MKVTGEQSTVLSFLGFSQNVSGQKLLVYHILILIHRGAKLYSQMKANLKILNSAPGLEVYLYFYLTADSLTKVLQKCSLSSPLPTILSLSKPLTWIGCHSNQKAKLKTQ